MASRPNTGMQSSNQLNSCNKPYAATTITTASTARLKNDGLATGLAKVAFACKYIIASSPEKTTFQLSKMYYFIYKKYIQIGNKCKQKQKFA